MAIVLSLWLVYLNFLALYMRFPPIYFRAFSTELAFATMHSASSGFPSVQWEDTDSCRQQCQEIFQSHRLIHLQQPIRSRPKMELSTLQSLLLDVVSQSEISDHWTMESTTGSLEVAKVALAGAQTEDGENWRVPKVG